VGKAWGGGAYFEAMLSFNPGEVVIEDRDWPAFYGLSWELAGGTDQAVNRATGYKHFSELDFMEYGFWNHRGHQPNYDFFWQTIRKPVANLVTLACELREYYPAHEFHGLYQNGHRSSYYCPTK
jgi:hypothetical protein